MDPAAVKHVGAKLLAGVEEESLEEVKFLIVTVLMQLRQELHRDVYD